MATLLSSYNDIEFTLLPHALDAELQKGLITYPSEKVIGYAVYTKETNDYTFTYSTSEQDNEHWSLDILKSSPYCENSYMWIVFDCPPHKTATAFQSIVGERIHVDKWDTWTIEDTDVAVITSWEIA
jgi:hypothetical protein